MTRHVYRRPFDYAQRGRILRSRQFAGWRSVSPKIISGIVFVNITPTGNSMVNITPTSDAEVNITPTEDVSIA